MEQYLFLKKKFLKAKNRIFGKFDFFEMDEEKSFDIDEVKDLKLVRKILKINIYFIWLKFLTTLVLLKEEW